MLIRCSSDIYKQCKYIYTTERMNEQKKNTYNHPLTYTGIHIQTCICVHTHKYTQVHACMHKCTYPTTEIQM